MRKYKLNELNNTKEDCDMCKYKDTNLGIKKLDFKGKRGTMAVYLTDGREIIVPISTFEASSRIYSIKDLLRL